MGNVLNLAGGLAAWASMAAVIFEVAQDVDAGVTSLRFGPNKYLGLSDLVALLRTWRNRRLTMRHKARDSADAADAGNLAQDGAGPVEKNDPGYGAAETIEETLTSDEPSEETVRTITLKPNAIADTTGESAIDIRPREVGIIDAATLAIEKRQALVSAPYGDPLGQISDSITVIVAMQYDVSTHELQIKTRTVKVIDPGDVSDWTTITGGDAAPCPE
jgi:hypothetical protein